MISDWALLLIKRNEVYLTALSGTFSIKVAKLYKI